MTPSNRTGSPLRGLAPTLVVWGLVAGAGAGTLPTKGAAAPASPPAAVLSDPATPLPVVPSDPAIPDHQAFTELLERVVRLPLVDYARLEEERELLDTYVDTLFRTSPAALEAASTEEQLAFWINAYNACMLRLVVDHYPIQAGGVGLFGALRNRVAGYPANSVWQIRDVFSRNHCPVAGQDRSQDEIEHEIIRPRFQEPRIHFAVNCAAMSCPVLWPEAYTADELDAQLDRAVRNLIRNPDHFRLEGSDPATLTLNKVLDWYAEDFGGTDGLGPFFADYLQGSARERVLRPDTRIQFFEYDWTLNDTAR